jgi:hypothetical protein
LIHFRSGIEKVNKNLAGRKLRIEGGEKKNEPNRVA